MRQKTIVQSIAIIQKVQLYSATQDLLSRFLKNEKGEWKEGRGRGERGREVTIAEVSSGRACRKDDSAHSVCAVNNP